MTIHQGILAFPNLQSSDGENCSQYYLGNIRKHKIIFYNEQIVLKRGVFKLLDIMKILPKYIPQLAVTSK